MKFFRNNISGIIIIILVVSLLFSIRGTAQETIGHFTVGQAGIVSMIMPFVNPVSAVDFYDYRDSVAHTGLEEKSTAVIFLYREAFTGKLSLFMILSKEGGEAGATSVTFSGIPANAAFLVTDDFPAWVPDTFEISPPAAAINWVWSEGFADGMVLGPLGDEFEITLSPQFTEGITRAIFLFGDIDNPQTVELNLIDPIMIRGTLNFPSVVAIDSFPSIPLVDREVTFDATDSYDRDGDIVKYEWDFDGDGIFDITTKDPVVTHIYTTSGIMAVTLRVHDPLGAVTYYSFSIEISEVTVRAIRSISTREILPEALFSVTVTIETNIDLVGVRLEENLPRNWRMHSVENRGATFNETEQRWLFSGLIPAGTSKVITYEVALPKRHFLVPLALPNTFTIEGLLYADVPAMEREVGGDQEIIVTNALSVRTAISKLIPRPTLEERDLLDFRLDQLIEPHQLARAKEMWKNEERVIGTRGKVICWKELSLLAAYACFRTPVRLPLPEIAIPAVSVVRTIHTLLPHHTVALNLPDREMRTIGKSFIVHIEIFTDGDIYGVGFQEELPAGWTVTPIAENGFIFRQADNQWVFPGRIAAGETKTITYRAELTQVSMAAAPSVDSQWREIMTLAEILYIAWPDIEILIEGDSTIHITATAPLPVAVVISRWNVKTDTIDITLGNTISFEQMQRAITFWLAEEVIPNTDAMYVTHADIKEIIARWLTGTEVGIPLPAMIAGSSLLPCGANARQKHA
ncbi:PKD domain-containing protein [Candidatus Bipolaricaulota bacterium]|nr:PKD domain-containing protein [Candidatus Bipolaricaulota bacterium]